MFQEDRRKWLNEKGNGVCAVLHGAGDVYHDAASESCLGRDRAGGDAADRVPAVLLLEWGVRLNLRSARFRIRSISLTGVRPIKE